MRTSLLAILAALGSLSNAQTARAFGPDDLRECIEGFQGKEESSVFIPTDRRRDLQLGFVYSAKHDRVLVNTPFLSGFSLYFNRSEIFKGEFMSRTSFVPTPTWIVNRDNKAPTVDVQKAIDDIGRAMLDRVATRTQVRASEKDKKAMEAWLSGIPSYIHRGRNVSDLPETQRPSLPPDRRSSPLSTGFEPAVMHVWLMASDGSGQMGSVENVPAGGLNEARFTQLLEEIKGRIQDLETCKRARNVDLRLAADREQARLTRIRIDARALAERLPPAPQATDARGPTEAAQPPAR